MEVTWGKSLAAIGVLLAVGSIGWWLGAAGTQLGPGDVPERVSSAPHAAPPISELAERIGNPPSFAPLPLLGTPFHLAADDLIQAARRGDATAACRLAAGYTHCFQLVRARQELATWLDTRESVMRAAQRQPASGGDSSPSRGSEQVVVIDRSESPREGFEAQLANRESRIAALEQQCGAEPVPDASEIARLWRQSAEAGNVLSARQYLSGQHLDRAQIALLAEEIAAFRATALPLAWHFAKQGDPAMMLLLADAYSPDIPTDWRPLAQITEKDRATALALYRQAERSLKQSQMNEGAKAVMAGKLEERIVVAERAASKVVRSRSVSLLAEWGTPPIFIDNLGAASAAADAQCSAGSTSR